LWCKSLLLHLSAASGWHKQKGNWRAYITIMGKHVHLGGFGSEVEAARAYNKAALKHFGEFAKLNVIDESAV
jgi:hypothetical protein